MAALCTELGSIDFVKQKRGKNKVKKGNKEGTITDISFFLNLSLIQLSLIFSASPFLSENTIQPYLSISTNKVSVISVMSI